MPLSIAQQKRALREFLNSQEKNLSAAGRAIVRQAAKQLKANTQADLRKNFRGNSTFHKGVKVYNLESKGKLGPASYVRLGKIQSQFQERTTLVGRRNLVILLPQGERLGFQKISRRNSWDSVLRTWGGRLIFKPVRGGIVVLFKSNDGIVPVYKIQKSVTLRKRLSFLEDAERIGEDLPTEIERLANAQ